MVARDPRLLAFHATIERAHLGKTGGLGTGCQMIRNSSVHPTGSPAFAAALKNVMPWTQRPDVVAVFEPRRMPFAGSPG
jgi:hypothetical protein